MQVGKQACTRRLPHPSARPSHRSVKSIRPLVAKAAPSTPLSFEVIQSPFGILARAVSLKQLLGTAFW